MRSCRVVVLDRFVGLLTIKFFALHVSKWTIITILQASVVEHVDLEEFSNLRNFTVHSIGAGTEGQLRRFSVPLRIV